jgi:hypothetical protein
MPQTASISYLSRNYPQIRQELIDFLKQNYPEIKDYNDSSVGMALLELNAAVGDILSYHTDRMFNETQIDYIQEKKNLLALARTYGLKVSGKKPSVTILSLSLEVPKGSSSTNLSTCGNLASSGGYFDCEYTPLIKAGSRYNGGGQVFEILDDVDFKVPYNTAGINDRTEDNLVNGGYRLTKNVFAINGETRIYSRYIRSADVKPFLEIILPETNVLSVEQIIEMPGVINTIPEIEDFMDPTKSWYEVDYLAQGEVFVDGSPQLITQVGTSSATTYTTVTPGVWEKVTKKFITEYTDNGYLKIIFGSGTPTKTYDDDTNSFPELLEIYNQMINNNALGETPTQNTTLFVRYRVGGGVNTNLGVNVITQADSVEWSFTGLDSSRKQSVVNSFKVSNSVPALGGADEPSIDEIRRTISYNFGSQERGVQLKDYISLINEMPSRYGKPYRFNVIQDRDSIVVYGLTLDQNNKLDFTSAPSLVLSNIATYLSNYRMMNDYVKIQWGKVINLKFEVDVLASKGVNKSDIASRVGKVVKDYFDITNQQMGQTMFIGQLYQNIVQELSNSILTVLAVRAYNPIGGDYSSTGFMSDFIINPSDPSSPREIDTSATGTNGLLYGQVDSMYEIRNNEDITINVSTLSFQL